MLLLSKTTYPLETGLQSIFQESESTTTTSSLFFKGKEDSFKKFEEKYNTTLIFLIFSIVWSFKTCAKTYIKIKSGTKTILPFKAKVVLGLRYLLIFFIRVVCIVTYFSPYIGLLGIVDHYEAERLYHLDYSTYKSFDSTFYEYWNPIQEKFKAVNISRLFRSDYTDPSNPKVVNMWIMKLEWPDSTEGKWLKLVS